MKILKTHQEYLIKLYLKNFLVVTSVFASLTFILNVLEEIKFFKELNLTLYYPIFFTALNLPSLLFEIFPFIFLISTQMFFLHLYDKDEILIFKNYGVKNSEIIKILSSITLLFGIFLIIGFYTFSASLKIRPRSESALTEPIVKKRLKAINREGLIFFISTYR